MKIKLLLLTLFIAATATGQITFQGCPSILGAQNFVLSATDTTNDNGVVRNTYESTPLNFAQSCPAGVCEIRIVWNTVSDRWEIQLDNDGPINTPDYSTAVLYFSTTTSSPNPPDINTGNWQNNGFCPSVITTMSGSVDDGTTLHIEEVSNAINQITVYPNPVKNILHIETTSQLKSIVLFSMLGEKISSTNQNNIDLSAISNGLYMLQVELLNGNITTKKIIKK
ncbi:T9SS type A sorting domain-containing protein [Kordia sp.]|uniref:T9SS type A sorting domain-containing protein n=1 Tax=Kordia sp. TaxID=1965332 RepID=UPI003B596A06